MNCSSNFVVLQTRVLVSACMLFFGMGFASGQTKTPESVFSEALWIFENKDDATGDYQAPREVRALLDQIVERYPASDLAKRIRLQKTIDGMDIETLNQKLSELDRATNEYAEQTQIDAPDYPIVATDEAGIPSSNAEFQESASSFWSEDTSLSLKTQISQCYTGDPEIALPGEVSIRFVLDSAGLLKGIPEHIGKGEENSSKRRVFLDAMLALEECAPYNGGRGEAIYVATFNRLEIASLVHSGTEPQETAFEDRQQVQNRATSLATQEAETSLQLSRSNRREIQNRLRLLGHDPGGTDGVFGPNTRAAISSWQAARGFPDIGYLNEAQLIVLEEQSETEYQAFKDSQPKKQKSKAKRVRVCKRGILGVLYDCRYVWR